MAYRLEIKLLALPSAAATFGFTIQLDGVVLLSVSKSFGVVASDNVIVPGANTNTAASAVLANLNTYETATGVTYSLSGTSVYVDIATAGYYAVQDIAGTIDYVSVYAQDPEIMGNAPVNVYKFSIEVIDTYENERELIEEFTQVSACKLTWDGGDDLYQPMMPSNFEFNMADKDHADGKFLHLLTGDENRYLVKIRNHDTHDVSTLMWQGYILPDLYSEPWHNGVPFIAFTANDMIASLKKKKFDPWYYQQAFNLPELFGMILQKTGLAQEMYVRPCLECISNPDYTWRNMNISLRQFADGEKYSDLYEILEKLLTAQGMQLYSFRGKWYFTGLTRRVEASTAVRRREVVEVYHHDGEYKTTLPLSHEVVAPDYSKELPLITAEMPWKKVNIEFDSGSADNLFPEEIVSKKFVSSDVVMNLQVGNPDRFADNFLDLWEWVGIPYMWEATREQYGLAHNFNYGINTDYWGVTDNYDVTEAQALLAYFQCRVKPFAAKERLYELEMEIEVEFVISSGNFEEKLKEGDYDKMIPFQVLSGTQEIISNRPSFAVSGQYVYDKESQGVSGATNKASFKLKREFTLPEEAVLTFRFLSPIGDLTDDGVSLLRVYPKVLKINVVEELEDLESAVAVRDINYTLEIDIPVDITCSVDSAVQNSFGIAKKISDRFMRISTTGYNDYQVTQSFMPATNIGVNLRRWPIPKWVQDYVFVAGFQNSIFMERPDGEIVRYNALYSTNVSGVPYMAVYTGFVVFTGNPSARPTLPKEYKPLPGALPSDKVMLMLSFFENENALERALWKIHGFADSTADSYLKTLAKSVHAVRPDVCFSIDATALDCIWPGQLPVFTYLGENKKFIPVRLGVDLSEGKTELTMKEGKLQNVTDISYE